MSGWNHHVSLAIRYLPIVIEDRIDERCTVPETFEREILRNFVLSGRVGGA